MASRAVVGLDIGSSSIKAVQAKVSSDRRSATVERAAILPVPVGQVREGLVFDRTAPEFSARLKAWWAEQKFATKDVVLGINNSRSVFSKVVELPWRSPEDLRASLPFEIARNNFFSIPADESQIDHVVLGEGRDDKGDRTIRLLVVAVDRKNTEANVRAVAAAGLNPVGLDLTAFAVLRAAQLPVHQDNVVDVLIDIGLEVQTITVHRNGEPLYLNHRPDGGAAVTQYIKRTLELQDLATAEELKVEASDPKVRDLLQRSNVQIGARIQTVLEHFMDTNKGVRGISSISLTGGGSHLSGLRETLEETFSLPVDLSVFDPTSYGLGTPLQPVQHGAGMLASAGLATGATI